MAGRRTHRGPDCTARETPLSPEPRASLSASPARPAIHDRRGRPGPPLPPAPLSSRASAFGSLALSISRVSADDRKPGHECRALRCVMRCRGRGARPPNPRSHLTHAVAAWRRGKAPSAPHDCAAPRTTSPQHHAPSGVQVQAANRLRCDGRATERAFQLVGQPLMHASPAENVAARRDGRSSPWCKTQRASPRPHRCFRSFCQVRGRASSARFRHPGVKPGSASSTQGCSSRGNQA